MINPGDLQFLVTLQKPRYKTNDTGEQILCWESVCDVWASIKPLTSRELVYAKQAGLNNTHQIKLWYIEELSTTWRILLEESRGTRTFNIDGAINVDSRNVEWDLQCIEA